MRSDGNLRLINQSQQMTDRKNTENNAGYAQSSCS